MTVASMLYFWFNLMCFLTNKLLSFYVSLVNIPSYLPLNYILTQNWSTICKGVILHINESNNVSVCSKALASTQT